MISFFFAKIPESDPKVGILNFSNNMIFTLRNVLERITGIEPVSLAWEAKVIPLYDIRLRVDNKHLLLWGQSKL